MADSTREELYRSWKKAVTRSFNWTDEIGGDVAESKAHGTKRWG